MTRLVLPLVSLMTLSCSHYQPLYGAESARANEVLAVGHITDRSVSGLGEILSQKLYQGFSNQDAPRYVISGTLQDVSILTSPVKPGSSFIRAYKVRAKLKLSLKDLLSKQRFQTTLQEEADFLLANTGTQDRVLDTEQHRKKALHKLAEVFLEGIDAFVADKLASTHRHPETTEETLQP